jgi:hypothetical protein
MRQVGVGEKIAIFAPYIYIYSASFYQDRLGTNIGKTQKKYVFSQGCWTGLISTGNGRGVAGAARYGLSPRYDYSIVLLYVISNLVSKSFNLLRPCLGLINQ